MALFDRTTDWSAEFGKSILKFCGALRWAPKPEHVPYLRAAERGYRRVGVVEPAGFDFDSVSAAIVLWRMLVVPGSVHFLLAPTEQAARKWIVAAEQIVAGSIIDVHRQFLFATNKLGISRVGSNEMSCVYLEPQILDRKHLLLARGRPTSLVIPDLDRVPSRRLAPAAGLVSGPFDLWITGLTAARHRRGKVSG